MLCRSVFRHIHRLDGQIVRGLCGKKNLKEELTSNEISSKQNHSVEKKAVSGYHQAKSREFRPEEENIILDFEEETYTENLDSDDPSQFNFLYRKRLDRLKEVNLKRGKEEVFDVEDLVSILKGENLQNVVVLKLPPELRYCKYMVIASARSPRHLSASLAYILKLYKRTKHESDPFLRVEGDKSDDWKVVDMDSIVLNLFMGPTRDKFDLETLWSVGSEYDDYVQRPVEDPLLYIAEKHLEYLKALQANESSKENSEQTNDVNK